MQKRIHDAVKRLTLRLPGAADLAEQLVKITKGPELAGAADDPTTAAAAAAADSATGAAAAADAAALSG